MPKLTDLMVSDHRHIERLLAQLTAPAAEVTYDDTARKNLADFLVAAESRHEIAEELVVWPAVRKRVPEGAALVAEGLRQERTAKFILDALRFADGSARHDLALEFTESARAHIAFEEGQILDALKRATVWPGLHVLGAKFLLAKRFGPTRPHPRGPERRFGLLTWGMFVATVDRLRDRVSARAL
jgi:hemerythrin-like domain-containing protein